MVLVLALHTVQVLHMVLVLHRSKRQQLGHCRTSCVHANERANLLASKNHRS
jgi:hypothetical protein